MMMKRKAFETTTTDAETTNLPATTTSVVDDKIALERERCENGASRVLSCLCAPGYTGSNCAIGRCMLLFIQY